MELHSERLRLRQPSESDAEAVRDACQDPEISRFIPLIPIPYRLDEAVKFLQHVERQWAAQDQERTFAIEEQETAAFLGLVTVRLAEGGAVGYWLKRDARGRGFMTEAVQTVIGWAREQGMRRLLLMAHPENLASHRVAENAGFRQVGMVKHQPAFQDGTDEARLYEIDLA
jgi:RimJ/RimL family protein N-acetyltransferase